jgi:hypothetical protein
MPKKSTWEDSKLLFHTIHQIAISNGTPNVMPTFSQMKGDYGLSNWIKKSGGVKKVAEEMNMVVKPNVLPSKEELTGHSVVKGSTVFVHNKANIYPAIVLDKGSTPGNLVVLVFNKKMTRKNLPYGKESSSKYQWCHTNDISKDLITITT